MTRMETKKRPMPTAILAGIAFMLLFLAAFLFGDPTALTFVFLGLGVVLITVGLIQRTTEARR